MTAVLHVFKNFLLEVAYSVLEPLDHIGQLYVLALQVVDFRVQLVDPLQFSLAAF